MLSRKRQGFRLSQIGNEPPQTEQGYFNYISLSLTALSLVALRLTALSLAALSLVALSLTPPMLSTRLALRLLGLLQKSKVHKKAALHLPPADASHSMSAVFPMLKQSFVAYKECEPSANQHVLSMIVQTCRLWCYPIGWTWPTSQWLKANLGSFNDHSALFKQRCIFCSRYACSPCRCVNLVILACSSASTGT